MSAFDPNTFLNQTTDQGFETRFTPIPEGEYMAVVSDGDKAVAFRVTDKGNVLMDVSWTILDEGVKQLLNMPKPSVRQSVFVDVDEQGRFLVGPNLNVQLGKLREALGQNSGPWAPAMLKGRGPAKIKVTQRVNDRDASIIYNDVAAVTRAA